MGMAPRTARNNALLRSPGACDIKRSCVGCAEGALGVCMWKPTTLELRSQKKVIPVISLSNAVRHFKLRHPLPSLLPRKMFTLWTIGVGVSQTPRPSIGSISLLSKNIIPYCINLLTFIHVFLILRWLLFSCLESSFGGVLTKPALRLNNEGFIVTTMKLV